MSLLKGGSKRSTGLAFGPFASLRASSAAFLEELEKAATLERRVLRYMAINPRAPAASRRAGD